MLVQVEQLLCIFSVPNNRGKFACRKNGFNILSPLFEKGKNYTQSIVFSKRHRHFSAALTCSLLEGLMNQAVSASDHEEPKGSQRRGVIAVKYHW